MKNSPVNLLLGLCLFLLLFASCSKEPIIDDIEEPEEVVTEISLEEPVEQYLEAQAMMLQLFTTAMTETLRSAILPSSISPPPAACVTYTDNTGGPTWVIDISIDFDDCDPGNGHEIDGEIIIQSTVPSGNILDTREDDGDPMTVEHPAFIRFSGNEITISDYTFKLVKTDPNAGALDLKFFNQGSNLSPLFVFKLSDLTYFEITDNDTQDYVEIRPPYSSSAYMKVTTTNSIVSLDYDDLYDNTYDVKFEADANNAADNLWEVQSYDYISPTETILTADFRIFTKPGDNLIIKPNYTWPLDGTMQCWTKPTSTSFAVLQQEVDFGVDAAGMDTGAEDAYIENCIYTLGVPSCTIEMLSL